MAENNKDKKPFSFVGVATEGMDMKEEQKRMLERKGKTISSFNIQEQEKDIVQRETQKKDTHTRFSENLTPSLVKEEEPIEDTRSNEGDKIEKPKKKKLNSPKEKKETLCEVRISLFLPEKEMRMLRVYLSSHDQKKSVTSFVTDLVLSKIKYIRKDFTEQGVKALLGIEDKEIE